MSTIICECQGSLLNTANATQNVLDATAFGGLTPTFALVFAQPTIANETADADVVMSIGVVHGDTSGGASVGISVEDAVTTTNSVSVAQGSSISIRDANTNAETRWDAEMVTNGVKFTYVTGSTTLRVSCMIFYGGDDILNVETGLSLFNSSSSAKSVTTGFKPNLCWMAMSQTNATSRASAALSYGYAADRDDGNGIGEGCVSFKSGDGLSATSVTCRSSNQYSAYFSSVGVNTTFDPTAITFTPTGTLLGYIVWIAIEMRNPRMISYNASDVYGGLTTEWNSTEFAGTLIGGMAAFNQGVPTFNTDVTTNGSAIMLSHMDNSESHIISWRDKDNVSTSEADKMRSYRGYNATPSAWINFDGSSITATGNNETNINWITMSGVPARATSSVYCVLVDPDEGIYEGSDPVVRIYEGTDGVQRVYEGSTRVY